MTLIKLVDARRSLNLKCRELFRNEKIAESIYRFLCDGIEECEDAAPDVPDRKVGKWVQDGKGFYECTSCGEAWSHWWAVIVSPDRMYKELRFCPKCGVAMIKGEDDVRHEEKGD